MDTIEISIEDANRIIEHCDKNSIEIDGQVTRIPAINRLANKIFFKGLNRGPVDIDKSDKTTEVQLWDLNRDIENLEDTINTFEFKFKGLECAINAICNRIEKLESKNRVYTCGLKDK